MSEPREFAAWIAGYESRYGGPHATLGRCREAAEEMAAAFPGELRVVRGHVVCPEPWGRRGHWWCELVDSPRRAIVDPTRGQFPFAEVQLTYEEYREGEPVRLGACMNCGAAIWGAPERGPQELCGDACYTAYAAYLSTGAL